MARRVANPQRPYSEYLLTAFWRHRERPHRFIQLIYPDHLLVTEIWILGRVIRPPSPIVAASFPLPSKTYAYVCCTMLHSRIHIAEGDLVIVFFVRLNTRPTITHIRIAKA